jgi:hypothetical protein
MSEWRYRDPSTGAVLVLNTQAVSDVFMEAGAPAVDRLAREGAAIARARVTPSAKKFIVNRPARRFPLESGQIKSSLSRKLSIPVALIVNNSRFASQQEVGSLSRVPTRPLGAAFDQLRRRRGVRGVVDAGDPIKAAAETVAAARPRKRRSRR